MKTQYSHLCYHKIGNLMQANIEKFVYYPSEAIGTGSKNHVWYRLYLLKIKVVKFQNDCYFVLFFKTKSNHWWKIVIFRSIEVKNFHKSIPKSELVNQINRFCLAPCQINEKNLILYKYEKLNIKIYEEYKYHNRSRMPNWATKQSEFD